MNIVPISAKLACIVWLSFLDLETFSHFFKTPDIRASTRKDIDQHRRTRSSGCWRNRSWQLHGLKILLLSEMSRPKALLVNLLVRYNESLTRQPTLATKILSARNQLVSSIRNYREIGGSYPTTPAEQNKGQLNFVITPIREQPSSKTFVTAIVIPFDSPETHK